MEGRKQNIEIDSNQGNNWLSQVGKTDEPLKLPPLVYGVWRSLEPASCCNAGQHRVEWSGIRISLQLQRNSKEIKSIYVYSIVRLKTRRVISEPPPQTVTNGWKIFFYRQLQSVPDGRKFTVTVIATLKSLFLAKPTFANMQHRMCCKLPQMLFLSPVFIRYYI